MPQSTIATYVVALGELAGPQGPQPALLIHARDLHPNAPREIAALFAPLKRGGVISLRPAKAADNGHGDSLVDHAGGQQQVFTPLGTLADVDGTDPGSDLKNVMHALSASANKIKDAGDLRDLALQRVTALVTRHYPKAGVMTDADDQIVITSATTLPERGAPAPGAAKAQPKRRRSQKGVKVWI